MGAILNKLHMQEYVWDFAVDGGTVAEYNLDAKANCAVIPAGAVILSVFAKVITAVTSDGALTLAWGNENDEDGYSGAAIAVGSLIDNALFNGWDNAAALLWDDANDHPIYLNVADSAAGEFKVSIAGAAATAGKVVFEVLYAMPTLA